MGCPVDIWTIPLDELHVNVLSPDEMTRAARFHFPQDRIHWAAARSALRRVLAKYVEMDPVALRFVLGPHGKPALEHGDIEFNLSHSRGWGMIAVSRSVAVGVDLEAIREGVDMAKLLMRIDETNLPAEQPALFQRWTAREARTKALGSPLMDLPADNVMVAPVQAPPGFVASVATVGIVPEPTYCGSL